MVVGRGAQWLSEQLELAAKERRARESQDKVPEDPHLIWDEELAQQLQVEEDQQAASHAASLDSEGQLVLKVRLARLCLRVRVLPFLQAHLRHSAPPQDEELARRLQVEEEQQAAAHAAAMDAEGRLQDQQLALKVGGCVVFCVQVTHTCFARTHGIGGVACESIRDVLLDVTNGPWRLP